ncbi:MAG: DUF4260 domain-containing protein [Chloroflexi bacterium]|nr:DUF4260 domain-containing protein [Chloroflexota bacterium]
MPILLKLEEALLFGLAFYLFLPLEAAWWWFFALLLAPDLSALGYLGGPRLGALTYNLAHHKGLAAAAYILGALGSAAWLQGLGLILLGHASLDRVFGYGLKYPDAFQHTHLGWIGGKNASRETY